MNPPLNQYGLQKTINERAKQIAKGFDEEHDSQHLPDTLAMAALAYLQFQMNPNQTWCRDKEAEKLWPWRLESFHPSPTWTDNIEKAAALLIAAMNRNSGTKISPLNPIATIQTFVSDVDDTSLTEIFATIGNRIVGRVCVQVNDSVMHLQRFFVAPDQRRKGIGSLIMEKIIGSYCEMGCFKAISLHVKPDNHDAIKFYESYGFKTSYQFTDLILVMSQTGIITELDLLKNYPHCPTVFRDGKPLGLLTNVKGKRDIIIN